MSRLVIRIVVFLGATALGLLAAAFIVDDLSIGWRSFLGVVVVVAILQAVLAAWLSKVARDKAPALTGAVGLASTFIGLFMANLVFNDLRISGVATWLAAAVITWIGTLLGAVLLPPLLNRMTNGTAKPRNGDR